MSVYRPGVRLCGTASLLEQVDKMVLIEMQDGRHFCGALRSFDQFGNMVLESARERHYVGNKYADIPLGLYIIRGENVVLLGELVRLYFFKKRERERHIIVSRTNRSSDDICTR